MSLDACYLMRLWLASTSSGREASSPVLRFTLALCNVAQSFPFRYQAQYIKISSLAAAFSSVSASPVQLLPSPNRFISQSPPPRLTTSSLRIPHLGLSLSITRRLSTPFFHPLVQRVPLRAFGLHNLLAPSRRSEVSDFGPSDRSGRLDGSVRAVFVANRVDLCVRRRKIGDDVLVGRSRARSGSLMRGVGRSGVVIGSVRSGRSGLRSLEAGEGEAIESVSR